VTAEAAEIQRLFAVPGLAKGRENSFRLAGHRGVALLNDALLQGFSGQDPGA
jgi:hypothetical protein